MDRRNGGDPLAPPRPPKLLPRVHRPRAPEPATIMGETSATVTPTVTKSTATTATSSAAAAAAAARATQCTNNSSSSNNNNNNNHNHSDHLSQQQFYSITTTAPTISNNNNNNFNSSIRSGVDHHSNGNGNGSGNISNTSNNNGNVASLGVPPSVEFDDYQIHHLTYLPQLPSSLSRNSSHVSTASSSSSITAANSFTRRRQPPPTPGSAVPLLALASGSVSSTNSSSNFLSHFQTAAAVAAATDATSASPVTLAQPRPESERLTNEYVDTPLRTAAAAATATAQQLQLQHASRSQHPAGQHDNGQTTTHHLLQLPQRRLQQQQQLQLQQQHSNRLVATTASGHVNGIGIGIDGTDGFLHSHHQHQQQQHQQPHHKATSTQTSSHAPGKGTPPPPPRGLGLGFGSAQPITQPITKQPASSFSKEELFDLHSLTGGPATLHGSASDVNGLNGSTSTTANTIGPVLAAGVNSTMDMKSIMCPLCGKCRCDQCLSPRSLPQTWVCNKTCLCSAESVIDYASCLCCAKALFYHCARDNDMDCDDGSGTPCVDNPCSCGPYKRTQRWSWLGALSLVLPCLWFYWPMRGCVSLCEKCYARYAGRGCRCQPIGSMSSMSPIMQLSINGSSGGGMLSNGSAGTTNGSGILNGQSVAKSVDGQHHRIRHTECSAASRKLRKGDLTPEKCLLDSSPEY